MTTSCKHPKTHVIYEQLPPSQGRKLVVVGRKCNDCKALLPKKEAEHSNQEAGR